MKLENIITIKEYLIRKGIPFKESNGELITYCLFGVCDNDNRKNNRIDKAHLYFSAETTQYKCQKCGADGNIFTLAKHFGDSINDITLNPQKKKNSIFSAGIVESCHQSLPVRIRQYLNARGITDAIINEYKLGWGEFYGKGWITIPIKDINGEFIFFKLRRDPDADDNKNPYKYITYPKRNEKNKVEAQIYGWDTLQKATDRIVICEGEFDRLLLLSKGIPTITSIYGAGTFKQEWLSKVKKDLKVYICYDNDKAGREGAVKVAEMLKENGNETYLITLPEEVGEGGDITDYFIKHNGKPDDLFSKYAKEYPEKIDTSQFKPLSTRQLIEILGLTIKKDNENKLITFLCELSAYTESSQFNISFNAPSSTGKSYIPTEIARLFPDNDVIEIAYCSPTAFFHDVGKYIKELNSYWIDLSRKILIFLDQPHSLLLQHLRPLLSHDKKEIRIKITDKPQKFGLKTKNIVLRGFPSVIFCSAGLRIDEQEATRFLLLSPETNQEKIREAIDEKIKKETDADAYQKWLDSDPDRKLLKERIKAIRQEKIKEVKIDSSEKIEERFYNRYKILKPRHSRDVGRLISLIKAFALLNLWFREREDSTIVASQDDIDEAFNIWEKNSESQELNLPPYVYNLYKEVILPLWKENNSELNGGVGKSGLTRQDIIQKHFEVYNLYLPDWKLRQWIIPMLETSGLIYQEPDQNDKRRILIYPTIPLTISGEQNNSELQGGVKKYE